jgi:hypothetical protein
VTYEGIRPLGRLRRRRKDNIKIDVKYIGCEGVNWNELAEEI